MKDTTQGYSGTRADFNCAIWNLFMSWVAILIALGLAKLLLKTIEDTPLERILPEAKYENYPVRWYTLAPDQKGYTYGASFSMDELGFRSDSPLSSLAGR